MNSYKRENRLFLLHVSCLNTNKYIASNLFTISLSETIHVWLENVNKLYVTGYCFEGLKIIYLCSLNIVYWLCINNLSTVYA